MDQIYAALYHWVQAHGLVGAFVFMAVESVGVPLPTELAFITAQALIVSDAAPYWEAFSWIAGGHLVGSGISFYLGRATNNALARRLARRPSVTTARAQLQGWYARYGPPTILFGRLVGQVRPWASFVAGLSQVPALTFWLWTVVGVIIYTAAAMWVTAVGTQFWLAHARWRAPLIVGMLVVFYGLPAYKLVEHLIKRLRRRGQRQTGE